MQAVPVGSQSLRVRQKSAVDCSMPATMPQQMHGEADADVLPEIAYTSMSVGCMDGLYP